MVYFGTKLLRITFVALGIIKACRVTVALQKRTVMVKRILTGSLGKGEMRETIYLGVRSAKSILQLKLAYLSSAA